MKIKYSPGFHRIHSLTYSLEYKLKKLFEVRCEKNSLVSAKYQDF